jgi:hypothetical protein
VLGSAVKPFGRHLNFGVDPATQMMISWQVSATVTRPFVRLGRRPDPRRRRAERHHRSAAHRAPAVHLHRVRRRERQLRRGGQQQPDRRPEPRVPPARRGHLLRRRRRSGTDHRQLRRPDLGLVLRPERARRRAGAGADRVGQPRHGGVVLPDGGEEARFTFPATGQSSAPGPTPGATATSGSSHWTPTTSPTPSRRT